MSEIGNGTGSSLGISGRSFTETSEEGGIRFSLNLVAAARRHLDFLRTIDDSPWIHLNSTLLQAIRRYDQLWMPLISDLSNGSSPVRILPPVDIQWVWHCHTLNPVNYRKYCESRFSKIMEKPAIFDDENEEYALNRCRDIWILKYPSEPFELEPDSIPEIETVINEDLLAEVLKHRSLYSKLSAAFMAETVYLIAARQRYKKFLHLLQTLKEEDSRLLPTSDILLMWLTHQSYPCAYAVDLKEIEGDLEKVIGVWDSVKKEEVKAIKELWEKTFDEPYEKAGANIDGIVLDSMKSMVNWEVSDFDVNKKYKSMEPRFLMEVCVFLRPIGERRKAKEEISREFLRLRMIRCYKELKIDKPTIDLPLEAWGKTWNLYCEFSSRGVILEERRRGGGCLRKNSLKNSLVFLWNDLLRATSLTMEREVDENVRVVASITPPVQAPYLLKCVPDRVTDDSGAMISDVILRMNRFRPQEGRWLSRTVLDHAGRECFVVRIRVGEGFWRRGGESPEAVKREERIIEIREGSWSYIAGSIGTAPEKVVGTATPLEEESGENKLSWKLSTGDELTIQLQSSSSPLSGLNFHLKNPNLNHLESQLRLLRGRKMQYQVKKPDHNEEKEDDEEESFVTMIRYTPENPKGKATALLNWRLLVVEFLPDEDAVFVLLLSMAILRSVSEMKKEDMGNLLVRRRFKETKVGLRDWGSVIINPSCLSSCNSYTLSDPHLQPWYWNAKAVMVSDENDGTMRQQSAFNYSPAEGGDKLYKRGIMI